MNCNLRRRTNIFHCLIHAVSFILVKWHTRTYIFCKTFWIMWLKLFENFVEEIISVKLQIADGLLEVGLIWDIFQKLWLQISSPFLWNTCFSCHLIWRVAEFSFILSDTCIFYKIMFIHEIKLDFPKIQKVFDFNLLFIWMKNFLVEDCYLQGKHLLTGKVNIFKIKKCYLSLSSESLKNIHESILVLG